MESKYNRQAHMDARNLLSRARNAGTPIVDGEQVVFLWRGKKPPRLMGDWTGWEMGRPVELEQAGDSVWVHKAAFPPGAYLEYSFVKDGGERVLDPLNARSIPNGVGSINNFFYMPGGGPAKYVRRQPGRPRGTVTRGYVSTEGFLPGSRREVLFYQPPVDERVPLMLVFDGRDYARRAKLPVILDNLIADERCKPIALAMIQHAGKLRPLEYACSDLLLLFVHYRLLPLASQSLNLVDIASTPGAFGVGGASMGGVMALYCGLRAPETFGRVLSQSGAFTYFGGLDSVVYDLVGGGAGKRLKIWMDIGRFDFLLETNRRMRDLLVGKGYDVTYHEYAGGHNFTSWSNDLHRGLEALWAPNKT